MGQYTFPTNLRRIRKERGLSQTALAEKIGVSQASISYYEQNIEYPTVDKIYDLARVLNVEIEELISEQ
jgi:transcriptional regulator with XRE-family HTH domain